MLVVMKLCGPTLERGRVPCQDARTRSAREPRVRQRQHNLCIVEESRRVNEVRGKRSAAARSSSQRKDLYTALDTKYTNIRTLHRALSKRGNVSLYRKLYHVYD